MKIRNVSMLAAAVAAVGLTSAASGVTLGTLIGPYGGPIVMKFSGYNEGAIYTVPNGVTSGQAALDALTQIRPLNPVPADAPAQSEDSWTVFRVSSIEDGGQQTLWGDLELSPDGKRYQITGILWGENDVYLDQTSVTGGVNQVIRGTGLKFAMWVEADPTSSTSFFGATSTAVDPNSRDDTTPWLYPTINEGTLIWTGTSTELFTGAGYDYETSVVISGGVVTGGAGGSLAGNLGTVAGLGTGAWNYLLDGVTDPDLFATFSILNGRPNVNQRGFTTVVNDPIYAAVIPTPSAFGGGILLASIAGMSIYRRRRADR